MATVLLIEDEARIRKLLARLLAEIGHTVVEASNGKEGDKLFADHRPALVVTDIMMPEQEGVETINSIRSRAPTTPIVAISGGGKTLLEFAKEFGATRTLAKPFRPSEFVKAVMHLLPN
jgi:two-component system chemotaxis response regulator CheY